MKYLLLLFFYLEVLTIQSQKIIFTTTETSAVRSVIEQEEREEVKKSIILQNMNKIIIKDTLGYDSIVLKYYTNRQLWNSSCYKEGKKEGIETDYHLNGQLHYRRAMSSGKPIYDELVVFDRWGQITTFYQSHWIDKMYYYYVFNLFKEKAIRLSIYNSSDLTDTNLVAVCQWNKKKNRWEKADCYTIFTAYKCIKKQKSKVDKTISAWKNVSYWRKLVKKHNKITKHLMQYDSYYNIVTYK